MSWEKIINIQMDTYFHPNFDTTHVTSKSLAV